MTAFPIFEKAGQAIVETANFLWGTPLLILLLGGGIYFFIYSELAPLRYFGHAVNVLRGKFLTPDESGQLNPYQALSASLAGTIGMGNVSGVAVAISVGGPGSVFWMWITALIGISTEFFINTLAVMYKGRDSGGEIQGGPMYFITEGLGKQWKPMAVFFAVVCLMGVSPMFQANQLTQMIRDVLLIPNHVATGFYSNLITGIIIALTTAVVIIGGIQRIAKVTAKIVPVMVILYMISVLYIIFSNYTRIVPTFSLIFTDAFTGNAIAGGALGSVIITGVRRAVFSNEAGIGTTPMAHGAAKSSHPVRQGLVAMFGPVIDTIFVCSLTAIAILITSTWKESQADGITLTAQAFGSAIPGAGKYILVVCVLFFAMSTLFAYPYYGVKCLAYLAGKRFGNIYNYIFLVFIVVGAVSGIAVVISLFDIAYALMAFPTIFAAVLLSPQVKRKAKEYFSQLKN